mgnify:CR=1 FL=1
MVRITNYQKRLSEQGKEFFTLELQDEIEVVLQEKQLCHVLLMN